MVRGVRQAAQLIEECESFGLATTLVIPSGLSAVRVQMSARRSKTSASGMAGLMRLAFAASARCGASVTARVAGRRIGRRCCLGCAQSKQARHWLMKG
jgi:hypothetical protein